MRFGRLASPGRPSAPSAPNRSDVVLFDPATIIDRATYREPTLPPDGLRDVVVNGTVVVRGGRLISGVWPGRAVRGPIQ